jgi:thioesterase domain-containing protein
VPLQPRGTRAPVFGVPGHNGDVFCYRFLAQQLGEDQPFFGLQPPGADGQREPLTCIEDLAAYFAAQILAYRPDGPYVITGYCAGGTIAFELARQLLEQGATIRFVALFTSPYPTAYRAVPQLRQRIAGEVEGLSRHARALLSLSNRERRQYIIQRLRDRKARRSAPPAPPDPVEVLRAKIQAATIVGLRRYTPRHFDGRLSLFIPNKGWLRPGSPMLRWKRVARETEMYVGPDGCHGDHMLLEPHVPVFADLFRGAAP